MNIKIIIIKHISKKFKSDSDYINEYKTHIGYGASGQYTNGVGLISSHKEQCEKLEKEGYKNLNFCNGGDDDILVVDHDSKEFGFFEDYAPFGENLKTAKTLTELWKNHS